MPFLLNGGTPARIKDFQSNLVNSGDKLSDSWFIFDLEKFRVRVDRNPNEKIVNSRQPLSGHLRISIFLAIANA